MFYIVFFDVGATMRTTVTATAAIAIATATVAAFARYFFVNTKSDNRGKGYGNHGEDENIKPFHKNIIPFNMICSLLFDSDGESPYYTVR